MGQKSSSVSHDANVLKTGFMAKRDTDGTKYKKTWCILYDNGMMVYNANPNDSKEMGHSNFATIQRLEKDGVCFQVTTNKETLKFRCQDVSDSIDWISLIRSVSKIPESNESNLGGVITSESPPKPHIRSLETNPEKVTPIGLLFRFFSLKDEPLIIDGIEDLSLQKQLDILSFNNISTAKARTAFVLKLCDDLPALKESDEKQERFQEILQLLEGQQRTICVASPIEWTEQQISMSLFCYLMNRLRREPVDDYDKKKLAREMKSADTFWMFTHYLMRFNEEKKWNGKALNDYFNEITQNGTKTSGFGFKMANLICTEYALKLGKYAPVRKQLRAWYIDHLVGRIKTWQHVITALGHENEALSPIVAATIAKMEFISTYSDKGSLKKVIDALKRKNVTFPEIQYVEALCSRASEGKSVNADTLSLAFNPYHFLLNLS